jgi:IS5 family transposase
MNKWYLMIAGSMLIAATAQADCGACEGAEKAKGKAACEMKKGADKAECAAEKAACEMKAKKDKAACEAEGAGKKMKKHKKEHNEMMKESKDNASEQARENRKKWWKFWGGDETAE